ncbi:hypothetical protein Ciccas_011269 [Cichlidogyrus casuarinus]|uniref:Uncharacterized protein n=1 Tax=Cichlidogyrus casuarinus TaxID=1844966 RepID=A0ABD2PRS2_9PLAT
MEIVSINVAANYKFSYKKPGMTKCSSILLRDLYKEPNGREILDSFISSLTVEFEKGNSAVTNESSSDIQQEKTENEHTQDNEDVERTRNDSSHDESLRRQMLLPSYIRLLGLPEQL